HTATQWPKRAPCSRLHHSTSGCPPAPPLHSGTTSRTYAGSTFRRSACSLASGDGRHALECGSNRPFALVERAEDSHVLSTAQACAKTCAADLVDDRDGHTVTLPDQRHLCDQRNVSPGDGGVGVRSAGVRCLV